MKENIIEQIKNSEYLIEEKRLAIKEIKKILVKFCEKVDLIGNIYEYFVIPACAISITLVTLFSGPIIYVLPAITAVGAGVTMIYKYVLKRKINKLEKKISNIKKERKRAYANREKVYENIFENLQCQNIDYKDYYHQIIEVSNKCEYMTKAMQPYKDRREKIEKTRNIINNIFDYVLAPLAAVVLPLLFTFLDTNTITEVISMTASSGVLLGCAIMDEKLTEGIDELTRNINDIKSDRTVNYIKRDLKLTESLEYLKKECFKINI